MPALLTAGLIAGGLGLLGGAINSQRKFDSYGGMNQLMDEFSQGDKNLDHFQRLAQDSAPSRSDLLSMAAATGGSQAAATGAAESASLKAGDQALRQFGNYRMGLDKLRANLQMQKTGMMQQDFMNRKSEMSSVFNNIASMGFGVAGNQIGFNQQKSLLGNMGGAGGNSPSGPFNPGMMAGSLNNDFSLPPINMSRGLGVGQPRSGSLFNNMDSSYGGFNSLGF